MINFFKRVKTVEVIRGLQHYQSIGYNFHRIERLQIWLEHQMQNSRGKDELDALSVQVEPRETKCIYNLLTSSDGRGCSVGGTSKLRGGGFLRFC